MAEASSEYEEYTTCPKDQRQKRRRRGIYDGPYEYTMTTETSAEGDEHEDYNDNNGRVGGDENGGVIGSTTDQVD